MAPIYSSTKSPTIEDSPLNRVKEFVSIGVAGFNIRGTKEVLVSTDKNNANVSKYGEYIGQAVSATIGTTSIVTGPIGKVTGKITSGIAHKCHFIWALFLKQNLRFGTRYGQLGVS